MSGDNGGGTHTKGVDFSAIVYKSSGTFKCELDASDDEESVEFKIGGIRWTLSAESDDGDDDGDGDDGDDEEHLACFLNCREPENNPFWSCNVDCKFVLISTTGNHVEVQGTDYRFCDTARKHGVKKFKLWSELEDEKSGFLNNERITMEVFIEVKECRGIARDRLSSFDENPGADVILLVQNRGVPSNKAVLALYSNFFRTMFFGAFKDKAQDMIELHDIVYDEFIDFLKVIYPERKAVDAQNVEYLLKLADRFDCSVVLDECAKFLLVDDKIPVSKVLLFGDMYHLSAVLEHCFGKLRTVSSVVALSKSDDFDNYSNALCKMLVRRIPTKS